MLKDKAMKSEEPSPLRDIITQKPTLESQIRKIRYKSVFDANHSR
jgi:hypothetical protein